MGELEFESYNTTPPLKNTNGMKCIAAIIVNQNDQAINLSDYFGNLGSGHFFTFQADGGKIYIALASNTIGSIDETATGSGASVAWPLKDGDLLPLRLTGGQERGTNYATSVQYASGVIVRAKLAQSGVATAYLRIYRSSLASTQGVEQFRPVGF